MGALTGHIACQRASSPAQLGLPILSTLQLLLSPCLPLSPSEEDLKMGTGNSGELLVLRCWAISRHPQAQTLSVHHLPMPAWHSAWTGYVGRIYTEERAGATFQERLALWCCYFLEAKESGA